MAIHSCPATHPVTHLSPPLERWRFSPQGQKTQETTSPPVLKPHNQQDFFYCVERGPRWVQIVRRYPREWKATKVKQVLGCVLRKRSPFHYYVEALLKRWAAIGIRLSAKDRQRAEAIPHRRLSRTRIEVYTDFPVASWLTEQVEGRSDEELLEEFLNRNLEK